MKDKYPLRILVGDEANHRFKMTTSIAKVSRASQNIRSELAYLEEDYQILVKAVGECLAMTSPGTKIDPRLMWLVGDYITNFLTRLDDIGFYLVRQNDTLARDMGLTALSIKKVVSFRKRYLRLSMVDPAILWDEYRENKRSRQAASKKGEAA